MTFSVIIPAYNYADYLPRAIESALEQGNGLREVIVVDDGSTDTTPALMSDWVARAAGRVVYLRQDNQGPSAARNRGIAAASGEYVILLDADDRLLPGALTVFDEFLQRHPDTDFVFGGHVSVGAGGRRKTKAAATLHEANRDNFRAYVKGRFRVANGSAAIRRTVFDRIRYPVELRNNEDMVVDGQILAVFKCRSLPHTVVEIHAHRGRLRNNIEAIGKSGLGVVEHLFDPAILPAEFMYLRREFHARRLLSRFRSFYLAGDYRAARRLYLQAVRLRPASVLELSYLRKFLRSLGRVTGRTRVEGRGR